MTGPKTIIEFPTKKVTIFIVNFHYFQTNVLNSKYFKLNMKCFNFFCLYRCCAFSTEFSKSGHNYYNTSSDVKMNLCELMFLLNVYMKTMASFCLTSLKISFFKLINDIQRCHCRQSTLTFQIKQLRDNLSQNCQ